eukprot:CAMPEP_0198252126 /NCGR_PEP_ID=MMETSP1447-20131203/2712_1 /TAXON_ID=420782 /ORGANISM="Chaetoceros dichaeta, Strain CCMP1751" /LENGTH=564 /DNA_ID=CAMNT_0043937291 /DNA_START=67 /DNA_END=1761 /DNA_ORIENTATION=-
MIFLKVEILFLIVVFAKWFSDVDATPQPFEDDNILLEETKSHSLRYAGDKIRHGRDDEQGVGVKRNLSSNKKLKRFKDTKDNTGTTNEPKVNKGSKGTKKEPKDVPSSRQPTPEPEPVRVETMSAVFRYETSLWDERSLKGKVTLDINAFEEGLLQLSKESNNVGITATLFNEKSEKIFQKTVGSEYSPMSKTPGIPFAERYDPKQSGWTGDTQFAIFSNTKAVVAATYLSSVVDTGLGALDEPIHEIVSEVGIHDTFANVTARMVLSHSSGAGWFDRHSLNNPHYKCIYDLTTTMEDCVLKYLQLDATTEPTTKYSEPGTVASYNNEAFGILSLLIFRKTGKKYTDVVAEYMTTPLGMLETSYDCPAAKSTSDKPQVAFGICTTGHDFPKFVQMLANKGLSHDGKRVLSLNSVQQMFSRGTGTAFHGDEYLIPIENQIFGTCIARSAGIYNTVMGYGLGVMFMPGNKGELFVHASFVGGFWIVAPGRYSAYIASSSLPKVSDQRIGLMMDMFERKSTFMVSNNFPGVADVWEELTTCGNGMYTELSPVQFNRLTGLKLTLEKD